MYYDFSVLWFLEWSFLQIALSPFGGIDQSCYELQIDVENQISTERVENYVNYIVMLEVMYE